MSENDYVATATAEKRLREVLAARFDHELPDMANQMAEILLADAEITYLPRKKSVSILLRYPEKASQAILDRPTVEDQHIAEYGDKQSYDEAQLARVYGGEPTPDAVGLPRVARFGEFVPSVTSAPEYHEDDYFTE